MPTHSLVAKRFTTRRYNTKVYSPSQTEVFSQCQIKRELRKWTSKYAGKPQIARWMGSSVTAGLAHYNEGRKRQYVDWLLTDAQAEAQRVYDDEVERFLAAGGILDGAKGLHLSPLIARALSEYSKVDPIPLSWKIIGAEVPFPDHGNARPDVIIENDWGFAPVDYKFKETLYVRNGETEDAARFRTLLEYKDSWQMLHYVWAIRQVYGKCDRYYICLGELSPKPHFTLQAFEVSDETLAMWVQSAQQYWWTMEQIDTPGRFEHFVPAMAAVHRNQYGECEYRKACFEHRLDENLMSFDYIKIERRVGETKAEPGS